MKKPTHSLEQLKQHLQKTYQYPQQKINFGSLYQIPVGVQGIQCLLQYLTWNIQSINLSMHNIQDEGLQLVINSQLGKKENGWTNLKEITLIKNKITSQGLKGIEQLQWPNLENINLSENKIDKYGANLLIKAKFSSSLRRLALSTNHIGVEVCQILSKSKWPQFQRLNINYNFITNEGLAYLHLADWPNLLEFHIANNRLDSRGMIYLQKANWPKLKKLTLSRNPIGTIDSSQLSDMGALNISRMKTKSLNNFAVFGCDLSYYGIKMIFNSGMLVENCFLQLIKNKFTFLEVRPLINQHKLFCNQFDE